MRVTPILWVLTMSLSAAYAAPAGTAQEKFEEFNRRIHAELRAADPEAEDLLTKADAARERDEHRIAADAYAEVFKRAPTFVHALRRQASEELQLGDRSKAATLALQAVQIDRTADNVAALARVLVSSPALASNDDMKNAAKLAAEAVALEPENVYPHLIRADVAMITSDLTALNASIDALARLVPNDPGTHVFRAIAYAAVGRFDEAFASVEEAHRAGLPDDAYRSLKKDIASARPLGPQLAWWSAITAGAWIAGALVLFVTGITLSAVTMKQSERVPTDVRAITTPFESGLRKLYRFVLLLCCFYYYLSLPILFVLVLVVGGGILYGLLSVGHIPIKLLLIIFVVTVVTGWSILKSVIVRRREADPGERLDLDREPAFRDVLFGVASQVGTRPVDTVFMTPGTDVAVFERGGLIRRLAGKPERCLILGAGVLDGMQLGPFRAVLAHEYGHFSNRDTAGGGLALSVRLSTFALATNLAKSGAANWFNPAWLFVNVFHRVFLRISQGASRLQEVLADRWAAILFGAQAFEDGLRHVIDRSVRFNAHANATISEILESKRPLANLYQYEPAKHAEPKALDEAVREAVEREPSPYDSHPRPVDRFRWVHALNATSSVAADHASPVWSLFRERDAIEERMTGVIRDNVEANHGARIAPR